MRITCDSASKAKQVVGVTSIVGTVVVVLSLFHLATLAQREARGEPGQGRAAGQRRAPARPSRWSPTAPTVPGAARRSRAPVDPRIGVPAKNLTFAAIADLHDVAVAHADPSLEGQPLPPGGDLAAELSRSALAQLRDHLHRARDATSSSGSSCCSTMPSSGRFASASRRCWSATISRSRCGRPS